ncbi:MAG: Xaa-Pro peptidase family protein [Acidobacteriia bacterium]|jgi:Xaa-Pro aminopeptidase|nr:Xaa-Pro peptidase family protein [Terriglobia bacterium]
MAPIREIQKELRAARIDAWLLTDFYHRDPISYRVLGLPPGLAKRRWFYLIPARGTPRKLVHRIEAGALDALPGQKTLYAGLEELYAGLEKLLRGVRTLAMQYSPRLAVPYVSLADAGLVELVRSFGPRVVSSADLVQLFEARWTSRQLASHRAAGRKVDSIMQAAFRRAAEFVRRGRRLTEYELQRWIVEQFERSGLVSDDPPIVAVGPNSGNPHYEPQPQGSRPIRRGDLLLLDIWAKTRAPDSVYYDITWTGYLDATVPERYAKIFRIVREARDAAVALVQQGVAAGRAVRGFEVDRAARTVIEQAGYGRYFVHRTGHNIGTEVHGAGANMDSLETHDTRRLVPRTCFSVEPGIYLPSFGIRSEVNVYVDGRRALLTGPAQQEILPLLS